MDNTQSTAEQSAEELNILFPNQKIKIGEEELEVKEYTLIQQLQYRAKFMPFIATLRDTLSAAQASGEFDVDAGLILSIGKMGKRKRQRSGFRWRFPCPHPVGLFVNRQFSHATNPTALGIP